MGDTMSDLKYKKLGELQDIRIQTEKYIKGMRSNINGAECRLKWINKYIFEKTSVEMTIGEIEDKLGHKVIII